MCKGLTLLQGGHFAVLGLMERAQYSSLPSAVYWQLVPLSDGAMLGSGGESSEMANIRSSEMVAVPSILRDTHRSHVKILLLSQMPAALCPGTRQKCKCHVSFCFYFVCVLFRLF